MHNVHSVRVLNVAHLACSVRALKLFIVNRKQLNAFEQHHALVYIMFNKYVNVYEYIFYNDLYIHEINM